jgi:hypothetical protein
MQFNTPGCNNADATNQQAFSLKAGSVGDPDVCLGAELRKVTLENGVKAWSISPSKHLEEVVKIVKNVKNHLQEKEPGRPWLKKSPTPFAKDCQPEIHILPELGAKDASCCMSQTHLNNDDNGIDETPS